MLQQLQKVKTSNEQKAYNLGCKEVIILLDKLFVYDEQEDDLCIERKIWQDFRKNYLGNSN